MSEVCDIIRDSIKSSSICQCPNSNIPQCAGIYKTPPECSIFKLANNRELLYNCKYNPTTLLNGAKREKKLSILNNNIKADENILYNKYGDNAPIGDINWSNMQKCLHNKSGNVGGQFNNKYFSRQDLQLYGYNPRHLIGGNLMKSLLSPKITSVIPMYTDFILSADLMVILGFVLLVALFGFIVYKIYNMKKSVHLTPSASTLTSTPTPIPIPISGSGSKESENEKWKKLIPLYEADGYCMKLYREQLGMPVTVNCI